MQTHRLLALVKAERQRQQTLVNEGTIPYDLCQSEVPPGTKLAVLVEEVGEVSRALNDNQPAHELRDELIQVAAVAVAWAEAL